MNLIQNKPYSMNLIQNKPYSYKPYSNRICVRTMRECRAASNSLSDCEIYQNKRQLTCIRTKQERYAAQVLMSTKRTAAVCAVALKSN